MYDTMSLFKIVDKKDSSLRSLIGRHRLADGAAFTSNAVLIVYLDYGITSAEKGGLRCGQIPLQE